MMSTIADILSNKTGDVARIERSTSVLQAVQLMNQHHIGAVVVTEGDRVVGIFTERDVMNRVVAAEKDPRTTKVGDVMTTPVACGSRRTTVAECRAVMTQKRIRHLPVVENGRLLGMISSGDILAREVHDQQATIEYLHEYMYGRA
jgi:CBS domain-containing protein